MRESQGDTHMGLADRHHLPEDTHTKAAGINRTTPVGGKKKKGHCKKYCVLPNKCFLKVRMCFHADGAGAGFPSSRGGVFLHFHNKEMINAFFL